MTESTNELQQEVAKAVADAELRQAVAEEAAPQAPAFEVILASNSPRRRELLNAAGVKFTVRTPVTPVDESLEPDLAANPEEAAKKLAERKAGAVIQEVLAENYTGMLIVTAPTPWWFSTARSSASPAAPPTANTCASAVRPHPRGHHGRVRLDGGRP